MVSDIIQLSASPFILAEMHFTYEFHFRFPLSIVFRIYDNCLASGIEAIFGFSLAFLKKNEDALLSLKLDQILTFLHTRAFEAYKVCRLVCISFHADDRSVF